MERDQPRPLDERSVMRHEVTEPAAVNEVLTAGDWERLKAAYPPEQIEMMRVYKKRGRAAFWVIRSAEGTPISRARAKRLRPAP